MQDRIRSMLAEDIRKGSYKFWESRILQAFANKSENSIFETNQIIIQYIEQDNIVKIGSMYVEDIPDVVLTRDNFFKMLWSIKNN